MAKGRPIINLKGERFGRLEVLHLARIEGRNAIWRCRCECGNEKDIPGYRLRKKDTRSCGCLASDTARAKNLTHGMYYTKVYRAWKKMRDRCQPDAHCAHNYAARGITVAFKTFEEFYAEVGDPPPGATLDRIDNNRSYEPGNVRWATRQQQLLNTRVNHYLTYGGQTLTLMQWARRLGIHKSTIISRLSHGWTVERALSEPVQRRTRAPASTKQERLEF